MFDQIAVNGVVVGATYALVALGLTITFGILRIVNFAHGQLYVLGALGTYMFAAEAGLAFVWALLAATLAVGVLGWALERTLFGPAMRRLKREEATMLLALGVALLIEEIAYLVFGEKQRGLPALATGVIRIGDAYLPMGRAVLLAVSLALIVLLIVGIRCTRRGRALQALAQDREAAALQGIDIAAMSSWGFALGAALAALAGGLLITAFGAHAGDGTGVSIKAFIMIMLGGAGVASGAVLGGFLLGFAESVGYSLLPGSTTYLLIFVAMICFLVVRPHGLVGRPWS